MIILKESNHINIDKFKKELRNKISEIATSEEFGFDDHEVDNYFYLDVEDSNDRIRVEVRAEVDYEGLEYIINELDPIIQKYDKNSYFEPVEPGIIDAYISDVKFLEESDQNDKRLSSIDESVTFSNFVLDSKGKLHSTSDLLKGYSITKDTSFICPRDEYSLVEIYSDADGQHILQCTHCQTKYAYEDDDLESFQDLTEANKMTKEEMEEVGIQEVELGSLDKGTYFTLNPISEPRESQVYVKDIYDRSSKKYWCYKFSDINDGREFPKNKKVYINFTF